jgi:beta-glucanase (GH16 family)
MNINRRPRAWLIVAGIASVALVAGLLFGLRTGGMASGQRPVFGTGSTQAPKWKAVWLASFSGPAGGGINTLAWMFDTGHDGFGNHEVEAMTASRSNVHVDGRGDLDIVVLGHGAANRRGTVWTSGRIQTRRLFAPPAGGELLVTASIRQPDPASGLGYWPAFWLLGTGAWPMGGEIDILEDVNALSTHSGTLECGNLIQRNSDGTFGPCHERAGRGSGPQPCPGCQSGFHTYSMIIDRRDETDQQISWYLDGSQFFSVSESEVGKAAWTAAVDHGFSIMLNVAVGGSGPDYVCACTTPTAQTSSGGIMTVRNLSVYES